MTTTGIADNDKLSFYNALGTYATMHKFIVDFLEERGTRHLYILSVNSCITGKDEKFAFLASSTRDVAAQIVSGGGVDIILQTRTSNANDICGDLYANCNSLRQISAPDYGGTTIARLQEMAKEAKNYICGDKMLVMQSKSADKQTYVFLHVKDFNDVIGRAYSKIKAHFPLAPNLASVRDMIFEDEEYEKSTAISRFHKIWCPRDATLYGDEIYLLMKRACHRNMDSRVKRDIAREEIKKYCLRERDRK
jgi:hypothetical protein